MGDVIGLSLGSVATESDSFDRPDVTWIYFGSPEGLPRQKSAARATLSTSPPTAAPRGDDPTPRGQLRRSRRRPRPPPAALAPKPTKLYLNEVSVLPQKGGSAFVELANAGRIRFPFPV